MTNSAKPNTSNIVSITRNSVIKDITDLIMQHNPLSYTIENTDFYIWLERYNYQDNRVVTISLYMKYIAQTQDTPQVSPIGLNRLNTIYDFYTQTVYKDKLRKRNQTNEYYESLSGETNTKDS